MPDEGAMTMPDELLTMIPGPTPVREEILSALARPTTSHQFPSFVEAYRECLVRIGRIVHGESATPFVVSGSGTLAMEMALVNTVGRGERLLVLSQGFFGDRWGQLAEAFGIPCDVERAEWGTVVTPERLRERLEESDYAAVAMTHVDTSTGAAAPVAEYCEILSGRDELVLFDGVCATAGMEERLDDWGVDLLITGAQKALGAPPGVAIVLASERAMQKRRELGQVPAYSADLLRWLPVMENPSLYFSTPPVNEILGLHRAAGIVLEEGLDRRFRRHRELAESFRAGMTELGFSVFTASDCLADTLSVLRYPEGIDDAAFRSEMAARGVIVAGALGPIAGKAFRVGHMGNIGSAEIERTLKTAGESLAALGGR